MRCRYVRYAFVKLFNTTTRAHFDCLSPSPSKSLLCIRCNFIKELHFIYFYNYYLCINICLSLLIRHHSGRFIRYTEKMHNTNNITNAQQTNIHNSLANAYNSAPDNVVRCWDGLLHFKQKERSFLFPTSDCATLFRRLGPIQSRFTPTLPTAHVGSIFSLV